jgi:hypothetical protein
MRKNSENGSSFQYILRFLEKSVPPVVFQLLIVFGLLGGIDIVPPIQTLKLVKSTRSLVFF